MPIIQVSREMTLENFKNSEKQLASYRLFLLCAAVVAEKLSSNYKSM